jgi:hypothetical protein
VNEWPSYGEYIERYRQLIRVMRGLSPHKRREHFNMRIWGQRTECGTVACAAGHAAQDAWFKDQGFLLVQNLYEEASRQLIVTYQGRRGWGAIEGFFGPSYAPVHPVFMAPMDIDGVIRAAEKEIAKLEAGMYQRVVSGWQTLWRWDRAARLSRAIAPA